MALGLNGYLEMADEDESDEEVEDVEWTASTLPTMLSFIMPMLCLNHPDFQSGRP